MRQTGGKRKPTLEALMVCYGELARRAIPAASRITLLDSDQQPGWSSNRTLAMQDLEALCASRPNNPGLASYVCRLDAASLALALPVGIEDKLLATLLVVLPCDSPTQEADLTAAVLAQSAPLLDSLARELNQLGRKEPQAATLSERNEELEWLFALTENLHSDSNDPRAIHHLMGATVERLKCCFGAVVAPEHGIDTTHASLVHIDIHAESVFERCRTYLFDYVRRRRQPLISNKVPASVHLAPFKLLLIPIQPRDQRLLGYVLFLKQATRPNFSRGQIFLARQLGHQIGTLLESQYDHATGLLTRSAFEEDIRRMLEGVPTHTCHALIYLNIDRLRTINDSLGFEAGDAAIVAIADLLRAPTLPDSAICCRLGGDNFAIFLKDCDRPRTCAIVTHLLARAVERGVSATHGRLALSLSGGVTLIDAVPFGVVSELNGAQLACASAKRHGGNRFEIYTEHQHLASNDHSAEAGELRDALTESRFSLYGQKIITAGERAQLRAIECLLRLVGRDGGLLLPQAFLPRAQRHHLLKAIDQWVIVRTLREAHPYRASLARHAVTLAVNIAAQSLQDDSLVDEIERLLADSDLEPSLLRFEITESAAIANMARAERLILRLREFGCGVALDDFGAAINSLSYLKRLPVSCVKVDASLTRDLPDGSRYDVVVQTIAQLARARNVECVAECVESAAVAQRLEELGVGYIQGFIVHKPEPLREVLSSLDASSERTRRIAQ